EERGKDGMGLCRAAGELLWGYAWPGNVRELENVIERAMILCQGEVVTVHDLPLALHERPRDVPESREGSRLPPAGVDVQELEKQLIRQALEQAHYNKSQAAQLVGLTRTQLRTRVKRYRLEPRRGERP